MNGYGLGRYCLHGNLARGLTTRGPIAPTRDFQVHVVRGIGRFSTTIPPHCYVLALWPAFDLHRNFATYAHVRSTEHVCQAQPDTHPPAKPVVKDASREASVTRLDWKGRTRLHGSLQRAEKNEGVEQRRHLVPLVAIRSKYLPTCVPCLAAADGHAGSEAASHPNTLARYGCFVVSTAVPRCRRSAAVAGGGSEYTVAASDGGSALRLESGKTARVETAKKAEITRITIGIWNGT